MAILGIGIFCEVQPIPETNQTIAENTTAVKPGLNDIDQSDTQQNVTIATNDTAEAVAKICLGSAKECVEHIFDIIHSGGLILIIVSAVIVIITVIGMCGASNQNKCLLGIYFALILILLIAVAIGTILTQTTWLAELKQKAEDNDVIPEEARAQIDEIIKTIGGLSLWVLIALMVVLVIIISNFLVVFKHQLLGLAFM